MDVGVLLRDARERAGLSQRQLARKGGTGPSAIAAYESGTKSPTVRTMSRLLTACGLQARVQLEPLLADVDARVDALLAGEPVLDLEKLEALAASLNDAADAPRCGFGAPAQRRGPVTWVFDGGTALALHGFGVEQFEIGLVVVLDEALRFWLRAVQARGATPRGDVFMAWLDADLATLAAALREPAFCLLGMISVRVVEQAPSMVALTPAGLTKALPVVGVEEVERSHPQYGEVLARWRQRRGPAVA